MALIDGNIEKKCDLCKLNNLGINYIVPLCENCFNGDFEKVKKLINNKIIDCKKNIDQLDKLETKLKYEINNANDVSIKYKYQIDLLNLEMLRKKLLIDLEANEKSLELGNNHANEVRKLSNWKIIKN